MSPRERRTTLALYALAQQEGWAQEDPIQVQAQTRLPWSVCLRLCQVARCRAAIPGLVQAKRLKQARVLRRLMRGHVQYFAQLAHGEDALRQPLTFLWTRGI